VSAPLYDVLLVAHVIVGVIGFGAMAVTGLAASSGRKSAEPLVDESLRRFFRPGRNWPARAIFLVPVLGLILLFGGDSGAVHQPWPWVGLGIWVFAAGLASARCWPAERRAQAALASRAVDSFRQACRQMEVAAAAISICFVAAIVVMVAQP
jgi:hypothetical protein